MSETMHQIGLVKWVQVQRSSLKVSQALTSYYNPAPLLKVERLLLSLEGVIGLAAGGRQIVDVHHACHPASRHRNGVNGVSIGFTSHYHEMRRQFGQHVVDGCAGENILIQADRSFALADLGSRLVIQNLASGQMIYLTGLMVATPCIEFSQYVANRSESLPPHQMRAILQFLDNGRRGFYATLLPDGSQATVQAGDIVFSERRAS